MRFKTDGVRSAVRTYIKGFLVLFHFSFEADSNISYLGDLDKEDLGDFSGIMSTFFIRSEERGLFLTLTMLRKLVLLMYSRIFNPA